ncbi:MAG: transcriptional regulator [Rhodobacteraceae bacterium HLUCCA08]|nr:MAG: transcriptional regulator [Rhodobacteraceae bacterium HLUCCA08]
MPKTGPDPGALHLPALDLARPAAEQIHAALRAAILDCSILPGARLSESEIAARFGASRTPVREALTRLREDALILTLPSRGSFVSRLSERQIRGAQFLREAIECAVVALLAETGLDAPRDAALQATLDAQAQAIDRGDRPAFQAADDAFHATLSAATGIARLEAALGREKAALDRLRVLSLAEPAHMQRLCADHAGVLAAIRDRHPEAAIAAMRLHLRRVLGTLAQMIADHGEYFD